MYHLCPDSCECLCSTVAAHISSPDFPQPPSFAFPFCCRFKICFTSLHLTSPSLCLSVCLAVCLPTCLFNLFLTFKILFLFLSDFSLRLYFFGPKDCTLPGPLPLGVSIIDQSIILFGRVFPLASTKHHKQLLDHFKDCIKQAKSARQQALQINIFTAFLSALKVAGVMYT